MMENKIKIIMKNSVVYFLMLFVFLSCKDNDDLSVKQPGFIQLSLAELTVFTGESFDIFVPHDENVDTYEWTLPDNLILTSGQGSSRITVEAGEQRGIIPDKSIGVVAIKGDERSIPRYLYRTLTIAKAPGTLDNYKTKKYGTKVWMIENLNEAGENGDLGSYYNDDPEKGEIYGRLYTWYEAMTGIPNCPPDQNPYVWGTEGTDDAGNWYKLDGTKNAYNIQIRGACPEGWHIPNVYDYYDLIVSIKNEYGIPGNSLNDIVSNWNGYIIRKNRDDPPSAYNLTTDGYVGAYLRGSKPDVEGGLWSTNNANIRNNGRTFYYGGNATFPASGDYPLYMDEAADIEFLVLPGGRWNSSSRVFEQEGVYAYFWTALITGANTGFRYTIGFNNTNFSSYNLEALANKMTVRCVCNY